MRNYHSLVILIVFFLFLSYFSFSQELKVIKLNEPNKKCGLPLMETFSARASATDWAETDLSLQELSDLLWAANGINRPEIGKRTAPSAQNAQDIDIYVFMKDGVYLYDAKSHSLNPMMAGDYRLRIRLMPPQSSPQVKQGEKKETPPPPPQLRGASAPIVLLLVSDTSRFRVGTPEMKKELGAIDAGIVSQNISLFCSGMGLATRPMASMNREAVKNLLKLSDAQYPFLIHPVGHPKK